MLTRFLYAAFLHVHALRKTLHQEHVALRMDIDDGSTPRFTTYGGIGPHRDGTLRTEYRQLPRSLRRADGAPPDDLAHSLGQVYPEFGIRDEKDLLKSLLH